MNGWGELDGRGLAIGVTALYLALGQIHALRFFRMPVNLRYSSGYPMVPFLAAVALSVAWPIDLAVRLILRRRRPGPARTADAPARPVSPGNAGSRPGS